jgi:hypothetical protein
MKRRWLLTESTHGAPSAKPSKILSTEVTTETSRQQIAELLCLFDERVGPIRFEVPNRLQRPGKTRQAVSRN